MNTANKGLAKTLFNFILVRIKGINEESDAPWFALPLMIGSVLSIFLFYAHILVSPYPSVQPSLLWKLYRAPQVGDYVVFSHQHELIENKNNLKWIKHLSCVAGQTLERVQDSHFTCDGKYIAPVRLKSMDDMDLEQFYFSGIIPENKAFVFGDGMNSFDSRHFGFVDYDIMRAYKAVF